MNNNITIIDKLRRHHRYTWLIFGAAFLLISYNWTGTHATLNVAPPLLLLGLYYLAGQFAALQIASQVVEITPAMFYAVLFEKTVKIGILWSIISFILHFGILIGVGSIDATSEIALKLPVLRTTLTTYIGAIVFPFMACLSASATLSKG